MKILLINNRYPTSEMPHIATFIRSIFESLISCGASVHLLVSKRNKLGGIQKIIDSVLFYIQLIFYKYNSYDLLYINRFNHFGFILATKIKNRHKVVIHWHGSELRNINRLHRLSFYFLKKRYFHIVPSEYYKMLLKSSLNINNDKIIISPSGGVDFSLFKEEKGDAVNKNSIVLGFASGAKKEKGFSLVIQLINELKEISSLVGKEVFVKIIEYGEEKKLLNEIRDLEKVILVKPMEKNEMLSFYNSCDILLFPTHYESLGLVGLEAMACNKPVVGTDCTSLPEYIIPGKTGLLFEKDNYDSFKESVLQLINNIEDYKPREYIKHYSKEKVNIGYNNILEKITIS